MNKPSTTSYLLALILFAIGLDTAHAATLSPQEKIAATYIETHQPEALALLERAVNINSGTMNFEGVREVGQLFDSELHDLGFETRWIDGTAFNRAGHLLATRGNAGQSILLIGHLDTVFDKNSPLQQYQLVNAHTATGPGVSDMKGGIVVALLALRALDAVHALDRLRIVFVMDGDEESPGTPLGLARKALLDASQQVNVALGLENAADDPKTAVSARRSSSSWMLQVTGHSSHSSQIFSPAVGSGAIYELARILDGWRSTFAGERYLTFSPGMILGGTDVAYDADNKQGAASGKNNVVAQTAVASGDLRALTFMQRDRMKKRMMAIASRNLPNTHAQLTITDSYPPMPPSAGNDRLLGLYSETSVDLGFGPVIPVDPAHAGAADISFVADKVEMAIDGLGLLGGGAHTTTEFADLRTLKIQSQRLAVLLLRLGNAPTEVH
jgi:glutamate carboxypeptidase